MGPNEPVLRLITVGSSSIWPRASAQNESIIDLPSSAHLPGQCRRFSSLFGCDDEMASDVPIRMAKVVTAFDDQKSKSRMSAVIVLTAVTANERDCCKRTMLLHELAEG